MIECPDYPAVKLGESTPASGQLHSPRSTNETAVEIEQPFIRTLVDQTASPSRVHHCDWAAALEPDPAVFWTRWANLSQGSPALRAFQSVHWLRDWYATLGAEPDVKPLLVRVFDRATGQDRLLLPLVSQRRMGIRILTSPDKGVTDTNGPVVLSGAELSQASVSALWQALRSELSRHGDLLRIQKMPVTLQGQSNPLALALTARPSDCVGHSFRVGECWQSWRMSLKRQARRESDRHWRLFHHNPDTQLERITDSDIALRVLDELDRLQEARMQPRGDYLLGQGAYRSFYRLRLVNGLKDGTVVLTRMSSAGRLVAAAYGIRQGETLTLLRVAFEGGEWAACSPGRLIMEGTAHLMWQDGCRQFDLSIGSFAHKRTFGCSEEGLLNLCTPLTALGVPAALMWHASAVLSRSGKAEAKT
jgi:CelD/BcsL family acetyltransferase involved in cellulose biosynthesis